jgi:hypothetical protein
VSDNGNQSVSSRPYTLSGFVVFLRHYARAWPCLVACLIGPMNKYFRLFPMYKAYENTVTGITLLYGFLFTVALFHYASSSFDRPVIVKLLPASLLLTSIGCLLLYTVAIQHSIRAEANILSSLGVVASQRSSDEILRRTDLSNVPRGPLLMTVYLISFFAAETCLIMFALVEYLKPTGHSRRSRGQNTTD